MNKTVKQLSAQRRRQRKKDAKKEAEARMAFEGPGPAHAIKVLAEAPADTTDWDSVIQKAIDEVRITQKEIDQREHILGLVEQTLKPHYPRTICKMFGSSETSLGFKDSNTDIHLSIGYDPYNNVSKKEGKEKASKLVRKLADCFKGHSELTVAGTHVGGRSPLVKLNHVASKTRVDLSLGNVFAVANSSLVRLLANSHPQVRPFVLFLRLWAITQEVAGRGRPKFRLTNFVLTHLALFTCMARERRLVPSLDDLRKQPYDSSIIEGWECGHGTDVPAYWKQQEKEPPSSVEGGVLALALDFFEMYAGLDLFRWAVCPLAGRLVDRQIIRRAAASAPGAAGGPESDCDTDGGEAATDDDNDRAMIPDNGADVAMTIKEESGDIMVTDNGADVAMTIKKEFGDIIVTENGVDDRMITDKGADDTMITDEGANVAKITDEVADDTMITDESADDTMITDEGADDAMIIDRDADDSTNTDKGVDDTMIIDKGADDTMITDKGADDNMIAHSGPEYTRMPGKGGDDTMVTDRAIDGATVATADAVAKDVVSTTDAAVAVVTTVDAIAKDVVVTSDAAAPVVTTDVQVDAVPSTDAPVIADAVVTTDAVATDKETTGTSVAAVTTDATVAVVPTTDAIAKYVVHTNVAVATDAVVTTDAVVENSKVMALEGATHITDTVTEDAAVTIDHSTCIIDHVTTTNDDNAATVSNQISSTETDSAAESCTSSLPESLLPYVERIGKKHRCAPLCVMDMFALDMNFTYQYHPLNVKSFQERCRKSAEIIKAVLEGEGSLSALFTKIEVSL